MIAAIQNEWPAVDIIHRSRAFSRDSRPGGHSVTVYCAPGRKMPERIQLEYSNLPKRRWSRNSITSALLGIFSGPGIGILIWVSDPGYGTLLVGGAITFVVTVPVIVFATIVFQEVKLRPDLKGKSLALLGGFAALGWAVFAIYVLIKIDAELT